MSQKGSNLQKQMMLGNEAIAWAALESGVSYAAGYPGTPSSEIIQELSSQASSLNLHVEWSTNEKVAAEGAAAAAVAGLYSLVAMKNAGLSVALDFMTHLSLTGLGPAGGGMVAIVCDDPDAHSSGDETDSRWLARFGYMPLLEPTSIAEARALLYWAFDLSKEFSCHVLYRSYTRLSHASCMVEKSAVSQRVRKAHTDDTLTLTPYLAKPAHARALERLKRIKARFEASDFNQYFGPDQPEMVIVASGSGASCARDVLEYMGLEDKVGVLKLVTLWPFPQETVLKHLQKTNLALVAEEVDPFVEVHVKNALAQTGRNGIKVCGRETGHIPAFGEITPDLIMSAVADLLGMEQEVWPESYQKSIEEDVTPLLVDRGLAWCPGCPHRASFYAIGRALKADGRHGFFTGDIGCYTLDVFPGGKSQMNLLHAMGSSAGLACGLGQLKRFGHTQPVISVCGDSTFFHAVIPALINAVYNDSNFLQIILDNHATAMTGFQSHPATGTNAMGLPAPKVDMEDLCRSIGCKVAVADPFELKRTIKALRGLLKEDSGVRVLILRRSCEILRMKQEKTVPFRMSLDYEKCRGEDCHICLSRLRCPGLVLDLASSRVEIREDICSGCGLCAEICPFEAIDKEELV
ncbi:MAG: thiamine pyrophosphate-dependent enzyme [Desulfarculaceae bacterium]|jgi:indolepyruvate ferredoxin oxidoreductase alpha subunit